MIWCMPSEPFYDPAKSYLDNFERGPFGLFANTTPTSQITEPKHEFLGHPVFAPFGIPAGPLINGKFVKAALDMGFDIPVYKTVRTQEVCVPSLAECAGGEGGGRPGAGSNAGGE